METKKPVKLDLQIIDPNDKKLLFAAVKKYLTAKRACGDVRTAYDELRDTLKNTETKYGVTIFVPGIPEGKLVDAIASKLEEKVGEMVGIMHYSCTFDSVAQANAWLARQDKLLIKDMQVNTSRVGLDVRQIKLDYVPSQQSVKYQIAEEMKHRVFVGTKLEKLRRKWEEKNPQLRYVSCVKNRWGFGLIGGSVGFFRYIKEKYVILYAEK